VFEEEGGAVLMPPKTAVLIHELVVDMDERGHHGLLEYFGVH
jgi:hypothetical protein